MSAGTSCIICTATLSCLSFRSPLLGALSAIRVSQSGTSLERPPFGNNQLSSRPQHISEPGDQHTASGEPLSYAMTPLDLTEFLI